MLYREIARLIGTYLFFLALTLLAPLFVAIYYQYLASPEWHPQPHSTYSFLFSILICLATAVSLKHWGREAKGVFYRREGLLVVVLIWFISAFFGGLPFFLSGTLSNPLDAFFEAISGFTTTGATIMAPKSFNAVTGQEEPINKIISVFYDIKYTYWGNINPVVDPVSGEQIVGVEAVSKALLFWRSLMQWLGGMGIVVLFVAVLPALGVGGKFLYMAEVPGPTKDAVTPRIKETAGWLWRVYLGFTVLQMVLLLIVEREMPLLDAACITFSSLSTGGFTVRNAGIAAYNSPGVDWVIIIFMLVGSTNFSLYYHCLRGRFYRLYEPEFILYYLSLLFGCGLICWTLVGQTENTLTGEAVTLSTPEAIRQGCFHLISAQTSTGFATMDYDKWPYINQVLLLIVMFVGSMAGSTGGGIKIMRHFMVFRIVQNRVVSIFRPETVRVFRIGPQEVDSNVAQLVLSFYMVVIALTVLGTFILALDGVDPETALSVNACMINNIGMSFRAAGPTESFAFLSSVGKILSILWMVLGRLEFFAILVVLVPEFWRTK